MKLRVFTPSGGARAQTFRSSLITHTALLTRMVGASLLLMNIFQLKSEGLFMV